MGKFSRTEQFLPGCHEIFALGLVLSVGFLSVCKQSVFG
jgi:hypothetical protein